MGEGRITKIAPYLSLREARAGEELEGFQAQWRGHRTKKLPPVVVSVPEVSAGSPWPSHAGPATGHQSSGVSQAPGLTDPTAGF